jgi:hypothetical protein
MMKKIKKSGSYLSMENLQMDQDSVSEEEEESKTVKKNGIN